MGVCFLTPPPRPFTQIQSALFYFRVRRSIAFEAACLLHTPAPLQRDGVKGSRVVLDPSGSQGRPQVKSLNCASQTQHGCSDFRPISSVKRQTRTGKIIQIKTGNLNVVSTSERTQIIIQDRFRPVDCDFNCSRSFVSEFSP